VTYLLVKGFRSYDIGGNTTYPEGEKSLKGGAGPESNEKEEGTIAWLYTKKNLREKKKKKTCWAGGKEAHRGRGRNQRGHATLQAAELAHERCKKSNSWGGRLQGSHRGKKFEEGDTPYTQKKEGGEKTKNGGVEESPARPYELIATRRRRLHSNNRFRGLRPEVKGRALTGFIKTEVGHQPQGIQKATWEGVTGSGEELQR